MYSVVFTLTLHICSKAAKQKLQNGCIRYINLDETWVHVYSSIIGVLLSLWDIKYAVN